MKRTLLTAGLWATSLVVAASGTAYAAAKITGAQIKDGTITSADLKNGGVGYTDISRGAKLSLIKEAGSAAAKATPSSANTPGTTGPTGPAGAKGANGTNGANGADGAKGVAASLGGKFDATDVAIPKIGGPFVANSTVAGTVSLSAGTYLINANALFDRVNNNLPSSPVLMLALRGVPSGGDLFGADYGTAFTGEYPTSGNLEQTASSTRIVTLATETVIRVMVFGYNANQSDNGSGNYNADVSVSAVKVAS
ncbi:MAG: hypothetical protein JWM90_1728 [Thermoleophilia bacterium]|nr:hypothetical protein [Thermoleophilia bacterium]